MSVAITQGIRVSVQTRYVEEESFPQQEQWVFSYQVTIENQSGEAAKLLSRHWVIRDAFGRSEEVRGAGVIGQTPHLEPGQRFVYSSWCPLGSEFGTMSGTYMMRRDDGEEFEVAIAPFALSTPALLN